MKLLFYLFPITFLFTSCSNPQDETDSSSQSDSQESERLEFFGNTQGTTFSVICNDDISITYEEIEGILHDFDLALSTYMENSAISKINKSAAGTIEFEDPKGYFNRCYELAYEVWDSTNGAFDPTVFPLVDAWGFYNEKDEFPDSTVVDSLRALLGYRVGYHFTLQKPYDEETGQVVYLNKIVKYTPQAKLDFNAIAQGLAVDVLGEELERRGAENYFVEIGGEIRVRGKNSEGGSWRIGIDKPIENSTAESREIQLIVGLDNKCIATSGSYRKFVERDGIKYSHTIDPKTGYPVKHTLLSATVIADNTAMADAMATAFMVMGPEKTMAFLEAHPTMNLEVYLIFNNEKDRMETFMTEGFAKMILD